MRGWGAHRKINATRPSSLFERSYPLLAINSPKNSKLGRRIIIQKKIYSIPICCYFSSNKSTCSYYYAGVILDAHASLLCSKLCRHNVENPSCHAGIESVKQVAGPAESRHAMGLVSSPTITILHFPFATRVKWG